MGATGSTRRSVTLQSDENSGRLQVSNSVSHRLLRLEEEPKKGSSTRQASAESSLLEESQKTERKLSNTSKSISSQKPRSVHESASGQHDAPGIWIPEVSMEESYTESTLELTHERMREMSYDTKSIKSTSKSIEPKERESSSGKVYGRNSETKTERYQSVQESSEPSEKKSDESKPRSHHHSHHHHSHHHGAGYDESKAKRDKEHHESRPERRREDKDYDESRPEKRREDKDDNESRLERRREEKDYGERRSERRREEKDYEERRLERRREDKDYDESRLERRRKDKDYDESRLERHHSEKDYDESKLLSQFNGQVFDETGLGSSRGQTPRERTPREKPSRTRRKRGKKRRKSAKKSKAKVLPITVSEGSDVTVKRKASDNTTSTCTLASLSLVVGLVIGILCIVALMAQDKQSARAATNEQSADSSVTGSDKDVSGTTAKSSSQTKKIKNSKKNDTSATHLSIGNRTVLRGWNNWGNWTECSRTCGVGSRRRVRFCYGDKCPRIKEMDYKSCWFEACVCSFIITLAGQDQFFILNEDYHTFEPLLDFPHNLDPKQPGAVVFDPVNDIIFSIEGSRRNYHIKRNSEVILNMPAPIDSIAVDFVRKILFFSVSRLGIYTTDLDGRNQTHVLGDWFQAFTLEVLQQERMLYWFDFTLKYIERCTYEGTNRQRLYRTLSPVTGLYIDYKERRIWWTEFARAVIFYLPMDGPYKLKAVHPPSVVGTRGRDIHFCKLHFYQWVQAKDGDKIYKYHKDGGQRSTLLDDTYPIRDFHIWGRT